MYLTARPRGKLSRGSMANDITFNLHTWPEDVYYQVPEKKTILAFCLNERCATPLHDLYSLRGHGGQARITSDKGDHQCADCGSTVVFSSKYEFHKAAIDKQTWAQIEQFRKDRAKAADLVRKARREAEKAEGEQK